MSREKARALIGEMNFEDTFKKHVSVMFHKLFDGKVPAEAWFEAVEPVEVGMISDKLMDLYEEFFSETELDELIKFAKSPTFRKVLFVQPEISGRSMDVGEAWAREKMPEIAKHIRVVFPKHGVPQEVTDWFCEEFAVEQVSEDE